MKVCNVCKEEKPFNEYHKDKSKKSERRGICKVCWNKNKILHNKKYKTKKQKQIIKSRADVFNLSIEEYNELIRIKKQIKIRMNDIKVKIKIFNNQIELENETLRAYKKCVVCNEIKSIDEYFNRKITKDGKESRCKECDKKREKIFSKQTTEKRKRWLYKYRKTDVYKAKSSARGRERKNKLKAISPRKMKEWILKQEKVCYWCGVDCSDNFHIDHYYPLAKGGKHDVDNLVLSCPHCNLSKGAKLPDVFARERGIALENKKLLLGVKRLTK